MKNKYLILAMFVAGSFQLPSCAQSGSQKTQSGVVLKNKADSVAYAFGMSISRDLRMAGMKDIPADVLLKSIQHGLKMDSLEWNEELLSNLIRGGIEEAKNKQNEELKVKAEQFLEENKKKEGVHVTESGLQYEILREGSGDKAQLTDSIVVHYKGSLLDGYEFDSSYERDEPLKFIPEQVIEGWKEGMQLMNVGSHFKFYIPYQLGYGERGAGGGEIPPYSVLIFEVELLAKKSNP
jgi:FKBP-type peptidyl-prolyl cis-trans isomerase